MFVGSVDLPSSQLLVSHLNVGRIYVDTIGCSPSLRVNLGRSVLVSMIISPVSYLPVVVPRQVFRLLEPSLYHD